MNKFLLLWLDTITIDMSYIINFVKELLSKKPQLSPEAISAYVNRLPNRIKVEWVRDGDFIIGKIITEGLEISTQGKGAKDFMYMVNDALMTAYNIPDDYFETIINQCSLHPEDEELAKLNNGEVKKSSIGLSFDRKECAVSVA